MQTNQHLRPTSYCVCPVAAFLPPSKSVLGPTLSSLSRLVVVVMVVVLAFVVLVVIVVVVVVVVVVDFPPSPAGSCPSYHLNASSPKMLRETTANFSILLFGLQEGGAVVTKKRGLGF